MDLLAVTIDAGSIVVLVLLVFLGAKTVQAFKRSHRAVIESASLLDVIVKSLSARIEQSDSVVNAMKSDLEDTTERTSRIQLGHERLLASQLQMLNYLQDTMSNDRRLIEELEQLKSRVLSFPIRPTVSGPALTREPSPGQTGDIVSALTPTERQTVEILAREGSKAAPELGRRLRKSREHTARLMKKLYLDGYVDRESNHAPYRYKLNDKVRQALESTNKPLTEKLPGKA